MTFPLVLRRLLPLALGAGALVALAIVALRPGGSEPAGEAPRVAPATPAASDEAPSAATADPAATPPMQARDALASATVGGFDLVSVAPYDAIPAIFDPQFVSAAEADEQLQPRDLVLGVSVGNDHRAYGVAFLSSHEVVNDVIGGVPLAVTW